MKEKEITVKVAGYFPTYTYTSFEETFNSEEEMFEWWREYKSKNSDIRDLHLIW